MAFRRGWRFNARALKTTANVALVLAAWLVGVTAVHGAGDVRDRLEALGYAETVGPDDVHGDRVGVTTHDATRAAAGVNAYCSEQRDEVRFLDMHGEPIEIVKLPGTGAPGNECLPVYYSPGVFAVLNAPELSLVDLASGVVWTRVGRFHHDVAVGPRGELYALEQRARSIVHNGMEVEVDDHVISILSPEGAVERQIDLFELFGDRIPRWRLNSLVRLLRGESKIKNTRGPIERRRDVFHPNSIQYVHTPPYGMGGGNLLVSLRNLDTIALIDGKREEVVWAWGRRVLDKQHHPTLLPFGNVLMFDNGMSRGWSRVIEVDPISEQIVWEYRSPGFFSAGRGASQLLRNGNVLVTESGKGRVFEISRDGDVVWEFLNPVFDAAGRERATIYRMLRVEEGQVRRASPRS